MEPREEDQARLARNASALNSILIQITPIRLGPIVCFLLDACGGSGIGGNRHARDRSLRLDKQGHR